MGVFFVDGQVAAQQQVHDEPHRLVGGGAFQRPQLAVKEDAVPLAEMVKGRAPRGNCPTHHVDGVHMLVQQNLPAFIERLGAQGAHRQVVDLHVGFRFLHGGGGGVGVGVEHDAPGAQGGKGPGEAHFLPVVQALAARRPAVELRDGNGFHEFVFTFARYRASMISR